MRAFVAGATGLTGRHVVEALVARGVDTVAHVRPDSSRLAEWTARFEDLGATVSAAPWTLPDLTRALGDLRPDVAFALLGTTRKREKAGGGDYRAVDYGLSVMLIDALKAAGLDRCRLVYLSSLGAETGRGEYLRARQDVEAHLRASGLPYTIARPSFIIGDRDESRPGEAVGAAVADASLALFRVFGGRRFADRYRSITGRDLAAGLVRAALDPEAEGATLDSADLRRD